MAELTSTDGQAISLGTRTMIGRDATQCQLVLNEPFISRLQAVIEINGPGQTSIKNLSSRASTLVNGQPVDLCVLRDGDRIEFGAGQTVGFVFRDNKVAVPDGRFVSNVGDGQYRKSESSGRIGTASGFRFRSIPDKPLTGDVTIMGDGPGPGSSVFRVETAQGLRIGRAPDNDIVLDSPSVSRYHSELHYDGEYQPIIIDVGSSNGTFVNGQILRGSYRLQSTDWLTVGGYLLKVDGRNIRKQDLGASRLTAFSVSKSYGNKTVLENVSVAFYPREFVGLMGASGCGKSTLMDALNGMRPASSGAVYVNDLDLYQNFDLMRRSIGYVPQRDVLHEALTVERTLYYAGRMRLPAGTSSVQIDSVVNDVIGTVGLEDQRHNVFRELSGGQQKRLSLGIELITKPNFLFLDEPTSPLDPETTESMMLLFRRLADEGRIVIMVTHKFEKFTSMHNIVLLTKGGRLAYFGPPNEALTYFNCSEPGEIYRRMHEKTPEQAEADFRRSSQFNKYVAARFGEMQQLIGLGAMPFDASASQTGAERKPGIGQWLTLTQRLAEIKLKDLRNTVLLLAQAPIVALILAAITDKTPNDARTIFIAAVIAIWLGANNAIREIVSEAAVYARERLVNLKIPSYVMSKFAILSLIGLIQVVLFVGILTIFERFNSGDFVNITLILYLTLLAGASIGLFFSALVKSTEKAMSILPLILIPQLLLSGFLKPIDDLYTNVTKERGASEAEHRTWERDKDKAKNWKFDPAKPNEGPATPDVVQKSDGLGGASFLAALMTARWTIDALTHQVSIADTKARDRLASRMTVAEYQMVLNRESDTAIDSAYRSRVGRDMFILILFSVAFLAMTMGALTRRDSL